QVALGPDGEVYLLYLTHTDYPLWEGYGVRGFLNLARSDDGGKTFGDSVVAADEATEGVETAMEMANLFVAPDGDVYVTWLDFREELDRLRVKAAAAPAAEEEPSHGEEESTAETQLRLARSTDGGQTFAPSSLVSKPTCECCGTAAAQGESGPVFATTRSSWAELKDSYEPIRDVFVTASADDGATWAEPVKVHDDNFKISGCPDITSGLAVESQGRLHTAWYTGTESGPGVYYAFSDDQGATFSQPVALLTDEWIPYGDVKLALDGQDNAWVAFEDRREEVELVQVAKVDAQGEVAWSEAWPGTAPSIAVAGEEAMVTWATVGDQPDEHGGTSGIQALLVSAA
ncbi:MAG: sialidase family protein, partial [Egibacteraceae bacterium]